MKAPIRWGIIGCGDVTERKSGPAFRKVDGSALVAVMRRDRERARDYATRHGVPRWYDDANALIADPEVDAIYVATPPSTHAEYAIAAARAGKPAYVEKPMAMNGAECDAMIAAFERAGVPLYVAYYRRALPRFLALKAALAELGPIRAVRVALSSAWRAGDGPLPWRVRPEIAGGGLFVDLGAHILDLLDDWFGPIVEVHGIAENRGGYFPAEDTVSMSFRFESGVVGSGSFCFVADDSIDRVEVVGAEGHLSFATFANVPARITVRGRAREVDIAHPEHIQMPLIHDVVANLLGRAGPKASTGVTAARTTRVIEAVLARYYGGGPELRPAETGRILSSRIP